MQIHPIKPTYFPWLDWRLIVWSSEQGRYGYFWIAGRHCDGCFAVAHHYFGA